MKKKLLKLCLVIFLLAPNFVIAESINLKSETNDNLFRTTNKAGYLFAEKGSLLVYINLIINILLSLLGVIFMILVFYAGYLWFEGGGAGNDDQIKKARKVLSTAIWGLIIVVAAYGISAFVVSKLAENALAT